MRIKGNTDYGVNDYFAYYNRNNKYKLSRKVFSDIISEMNKEVVNKILNDNLQFNIPGRCGAIAVRKTKRKVKLVDGKIINTNPPDWQKTKKLWEKDSEAKDNKIIIRHTNMHTAGYVFKILHFKSRANFKNKSFYSFSPARAFKRGLAKRINDYTKTKFDSPKLY